MKRELAIGGTFQGKNRSIDVIHNKVTLVRLLVAYRHVHLVRELYRIIALYLMRFDFKLLIYTLHFTDG